MKKLSNFAVRVTTNAQLKIAVAFFLRASRRPMDLNSSHGVSGGRQFYVGMNRRKVMVGWSLFDHEVPLEFKNLDLLADTDARIQALKASGWQKSLEKVDVRPLVTFNYPTKPDNRHYPLQTVRNVRLIKADAKYYVGLEILPDNKFKFKKFLKSKATNVEVLSF